jgi:hypothetical protein
MFVAFSHVADICVSSVGSSLVDVSIDFDGYDSFAISIEQSQHVVRCGRLFYSIFDSLCITNSLTECERLSMANKLQIFSNYLANLSNHKINQIKQRREKSKQKHNTTIKQQQKINSKKYKFIQRVHL